MKTFRILVSHILLVLPQFECLFNIHFGKYGSFNLGLLNLIVSMVAHNVLCNASSISDGPFLLSPQGEYSTYARAFSFVQINFFFGSLISDFILLFKIHVIKVINLGNLSKLLSLYKQGLILALSFVLQLICSNCLDGVFCRFYALYTLSNFFKGIFTMFFLSLWIC